MYFNHPNDFCKAYNCKLYRDLGSDSYCTIHYNEMKLLKTTSDDFKSKIKLSKCDDIKCAHLDCIQANNLVEDAILFNDKMIYHKWCIFHYNQLHRYSNNILTYKCGQKGCKQTHNLIQSIYGILCFRHYNMKIEVKNVCHIDGCYKTAKLIHSKDKYWCKTHFKLQSDPEIFKSTEKKKYMWNETTKIRCDFNICNKKTKLILLTNGKYTCHKHYYLMIDDDVKRVENVTTIANIENIENTKDIKNVENVKIVENTKDVKWIDIVKTIVNDKKSGNIYDLLNKCNNHPKLLNDNGKEMCHAHNCKIYKNLYDKYNGVWCFKHRDEITELRNIIDKHDGSKKELKARIKEFQLRKFPDINHFKWIIKLLKDHY